MFTVVDSSIQLMVGDTPEAQGSEVKLNGYRIHADDLPKSLKEFVEELELTGQKLFLTVKKTTTRKASGSAMMAVATGGSSRPAGMWQRLPAHVLVDTGATETVGTVEAVEALLKLLNNPEVIHQPTTQTFRLANGSLVPALSKVLIQTPLGRLQIFVIEHDNQEGPAPPILLGTRSLEALDADMSCSKQTISFSGVRGRYQRMLTKNSRGHVLLDIGDGLTGLQRSDRRQA